MARPRSDAISAIEMIRAKDSAGGILNWLLPLSMLQETSHGQSDASLSKLLMVLTLLLAAHPRNQLETLRSEGMLILGHLINQLPPSIIGDKSISALAELAAATRETPELYRQFLHGVLLRSEQWCGLHAPVLKSMLSLINAQAASDEVSAHGEQA